MNVSLSRRDFAKGLGGLVLAFTLDPAAAQQRQLPGSLGGNRMLDAWIRINADGAATARSSWGRGSSRPWRRSPRRSSTFRSRA
jgi:hypothetical protein